MKKWDGWWNSPLDRKVLLSPNVRVWLFSLWVGSNALLAYSPIHFQSKCWILLVGILGPFLFVVLGKWKKEAALTSGKFLPAVPAWVWVALLLAAIVLRFYGSPSLGSWPTGDEALQGFFALELSQGGEGRFFYTSGQHPPLLIWLLSLFLRITGSLPLGFWLVPALFSSLTAVLAYRTARQFLDPSASFIFFLLTAFSFWPLLSGRWCLQGCLVPFQMMGTLYLLGRMLKAGNQEEGRWALALGAWTGLGSLTYSSWLVVPPFILLVVLLHCWRKPRIDFRVLGLFLLTLGVTFTPWCIAAFQEKFGGYLVGVSMKSGFFSWEDQLKTVVSNLTCLLWGPFKTLAAYGPTWGGLLNPFLGACFLLGLVGIWRERRNPLAQGMGLASVFLLAPGLLSADEVHTYRIVQFMPVLLGVTAIGFSKVLLTIHPRGRVLFLVLGMGVSFGLDQYHLWEPRLDRQGESSEVKEFPGGESQRAFGTFKEAADRKGPGFIFTDFLLLARGHSLRVAVHPFNGLEPGPGPKGQPEWAGLIVNVHYGHVLKERFPGSRWRAVSEGRPEDGGVVVGVVPLTADNLGTFEKWAKAHAYLRRLGSISENMMSDPDLHRSVVKALPEGYSFMEGDPFLESIYGEWIAQYRHEGGMAGNIEALRRALEKGYPTANLFLKLGNFHFMAGQYQAARQAYGSAIRTRPNFTAANEILAGLKALEKK